MNEKGKKNSKMKSFLKSCNMRKMIILENDIEV